MKEFVVFRTFPGPMPTRVFSVEAENRNEAIKTFEDIFKININKLNGYYKVVAI